MGQDDKAYYIEENKKFAEELKTRGASYGFETYPGSHSCHLWRIRLPDFLVFASEHRKAGE